MSIRPQGLLAIFPSSCALLKWPRLDTPLGLAGVVINSTGA